MILCFLALTKWEYRIERSSDTCVAEKFSKEQGLLLVIPLKASECNS